VQTIQANGDTRLWQYGHGGQLLFSWSGPGHQKTHEYIYLAGSLLATIDHHWPSNLIIATRYQHTDALGSPVALSDELGAVVERHVYEPYGAIVGKPGYRGIGFTGHVMDGGTGLTYMQQRYYDQSIGRFLSVDPVSANPMTGGNFNRYWYANNSPYRFVDPDGRFSCESISTCQMARDERDLAAGRMSQSEYTDRTNARGAGVLFGAGVMATIYTGGRTYSALQGLVRAIWTNPRTPAIANAAAEVGVGDALGGASLGAGVGFSVITANANKLFGPFHRLESPTQTPAVAALIEQSGELWGTSMRQVGGGRSMIPVAQAYTGPLPQGARGIEFYTTVAPASGSRPGAANWYRGTDGVDDIDDDWVSIPVQVIKNTQN
jgi:RHS repeat-associated protein